MLDRPLLLNLLTSPKLKYPLITIRNQVHIQKFSVGKRLKSLPRMLRTLTCFSLMFLLQQMLVLKNTLHQVQLLLHLHLDKIKPRLILTLVSPLKYSFLRLRDP